MSLFLIITNFIKIISFIVIGFSFALIIYWVYNDEYAIFCNNEHMHDIVVVFILLILFGIYIQVPILLSKIVNNVAFLKDNVKTFLKIIGNLGLSFVMINNVLMFFFYLCRTPNIYGEVVKSKYLVIYKIFTGEEKLAWFVELKKLITIDERLYTACVQNVNINQLKCYGDLLNIMNQELTKYSINLQFLLSQVEKDIFMLEKPFFIRTFTNEHLGIISVAVLGTMIFLYHKSLYDISKDVYKYIMENSDQGLLSLSKNIWYTLDISKYNFVLQQLNQIKGELHIIGACIKHNINLGSCYSQLEYAKHIINTLPKYHVAKQQEVLDAIKKLEDIVIDITSTSI